MTQALQPTVRPALEIEGTIVRVEPALALAHAHASPPSEAFMLVDTPLGEHRARRAVGCLVAPAEGDLVLVAVLGDGRAFVLNVLERNGDGPLVVESNRDVSVRSATGAVDIAARTRVSVTTPGEGAFTVGTLEVQSAEATIGVGAAKLVAETLDTVIDTATQRFKRLRRLVEEVEQVRAKYMDLVAKKALRMHAGNAVVSADQLVKMDAEQIHIG